MASIEDLEVRLGALEGFCLKHFSELRERVFGAEAAGLAEPADKVCKLGAAIFTAPGSDKSRADGKADSSGARPRSRKLSPEELKSIFRVN